MTADPDRLPPNADPGSAAPGSDDERIEILLFECLEAEHPTQALEQAVEANPELAGQLRQAYGALQRWDLVDAAAKPRTDAMPAAGDATPDRLGEYRLLKRIGAGGMGVVFLARDEVLQRTVALKLIRPEHLYLPGARERFQREVETIARLQHPGIVPIYGVGKQEGMPYFTMQHISGCSVATALVDLEGRSSSQQEGSANGRSPDAVALLEVIARHATADHAAVPDAGGSSSSSGIRNLGWPDTCVAIAIEVANALQHAHERGILHRDVKPSNILLTRDGCRNYKLRFEPAEHLRAPSTTCETIRSRKPTCRSAGHSARNSSHSTERSLPRPLSPGLPT
jgi:serine/threonine protein kinase